jgi:cytochrome c-type biogenesis protein CcmH
MSGTFAAAPAARVEQCARAALAAAARPAGFLAASVVVTVVLVIGSVHPAPPSRSTRIAALESSLKCPDCVDLSIRQSNTAAAANLRDEVVRLVDEGKSNREIEAIVTSQYGASELLVPPASGVGALAWVIPIASLAGGGLVVGVVLARRRRGALLLGASEADEALVGAARRARTGESEPGRNLAGRGP